MAEAYDAIVVGGGHNGLTCAAYLAKAGKNNLASSTFGRSTSTFPARQIQLGARIAF